MHLAPTSLSLRSVKLKKISEAKGSNKDEVAKEITKRALEKAMNSTGRFNKTYGEVPVFMIQQMRLMKEKKEGGGEEAVTGSNTMLPMYFNLQNMVQTWQSFVGQQSDPKLKSVEPAIHLMDLDELVGNMMKESEIVGNIYNVRVKCFVPIRGFVEIEIPLREK